jgi:16S rRNA processing protein RimM
VRISDDPHRFDPGATLLHEDGRRLVVAASRSHRTRFLVRFEGLEGREAAESLRGALYIDSDEARRLEPGEFWEHELVGAEVLTRDGSLVGRVSAVEAGPGQDRLVVTTSIGERLIPVVEEIVVEVDRDARRVVVDPPDGLLD